MAGRHQRKGKKDYENELLRARHTYVYEQNGNYVVSDAINRRPGKDMSTRKRREAFIEKLRRSASDEDSEHEEHVQRRGRHKKRDRHRADDTSGTVDQNAGIRSRYSDRNEHFSFAHPESVHGSSASSSKLHRSLRRLATDTAIAMTIPEDRLPDESEPSPTDIARIRRKARNARRESILDKAERLINERKRHVGSSSEEENVVYGYSRTAKLLGPINEFAQDRSPYSSGREYVTVPTVVTTRDVPDVRHSRSSKSFARSEIPVLHSDEELDVDPVPRPLTDTARNRRPNYLRYEYPSKDPNINFREPVHRKIGRTNGALVTFCRNGDDHFKGVPFTINRCIPNLETLLVLLNEKIPTTTGVKYIFKWPEGHEIKSVTEFQNRGLYIVSSVPKLIQSDYESIRGSVWSNKRPSAGRLRKGEKELYQRPRRPPSSHLPKIVTIINNLSRDKREKIILNPKTAQNFDEFMNDLSCNDMPVRALYTEKSPHTKVESFSHLFRELKARSNFIACGDELLPLEITKKRPAPGSNSSSDSYSEKSRRKKLPRHNDMEQIEELNGTDTPVTTSLISPRYDTGPIPPAQRRKPLADDREPANSVQIEIDGKLREYFAPAHFDPDDDGARPEKMLKTDWVYGFRGRDARHNLLVLPRTDELVYFVASVVILYNKEKDSQRHYLGHNEEITCLQMHPNKYLVASGQMQGKTPENAAHIRLWHGVSLSTYSIIGLGVFQTSIVSIGFSLESRGRPKEEVGKYMCILDGSSKHILSVWDWQTEKVVARTTTSMEPVLAALFYPDDSSILITYGKEHIYFWKLFWDSIREKEGRILRDRNSGIFEEEIPKFINCLAFVKNTSNRRRGFTHSVLTGDSRGRIMQWEADESDAFTCTMILQAHQSPVSTLSILEDGTLLSGAGHDIKAWDTSNVDSSGLITLVKSRQITEVAGTIRTIVPQHNGGSDGKLYIGTTKSCILEGSMQYKFIFLVQGHCDSVWAVLPHPHEANYITAGMDQLVIKWSARLHKVIWRVQVERPCTCISMDPAGEYIALGTTDGRFVVINAYNGMHVTSVQIGKEPIDCLTYSADGQRLAIGCHDGLIHIYSVLESGHAYRKFCNPIKAHASNVCHLDWSCDCNYLQSIGDDFEQAFWDVSGTRAQQESAKSMRNIDWNTYTCNVGYNLVGPWSNLDGGEYLRVVNRSNYRDYIITGDDCGRIRLYKYPCSKIKSEFRGAKVYSSEVTAAAFAADDRFVISCGGSDIGLVQWSVVDPKTSQ